MTRRRAIGTAVAVVLACLAAWFALRERDDSAVSPVPEASSSGAAATAPTPLAPRGRADMQGKPDGDGIGADRPSPLDREDAPRAVKRSFRVRGRVVGLAGRPPADSIGFVRDGRTYLATPALAADGTFETPVTTDHHDFVEVGAWVSGFARVTRSVAAAEGELVDVTLELGSKHSLSGIVLDPEGRPAAGVRIAWGDTVNAWNEIEAPRAGSGSDGDHWARAWCTTADDGSFRVDGLEATSIVPVSLEPTWMVQGVYVKPTAKGLTLRLSRAMRVEVRVRLDRAVADHAWPPTTYWLSRDGSFGSMVNGVGARWAFREPVTGDEPVERLLRVRVEGHRPVDRRLRFERDRWSQVVEVDVPAPHASEIGTVAIEPVRVAGDLVPLSVTRWETLGTNSAGSDLSLQIDDRGVARFDVLSGPVTLQIQPKLPFAQMLVWQGTFEVAAGRETRCPLEWPRHGSLRLRAPPRADNVASHLRIARPSGEAPSFLDVIDRSKGDVRIVLPVGSWRATLSEEGKRSAPFEVREGVETVVEFTRDE